MGQLAFACAIIFDPASLCHQVGLPLDKAVTLPTKLHQPVGKIARRIARRHGSGPILGELADCFLLLLGQCALAHRCYLDSLACGIGFHTGRFGCGLCLLPANKDQPGFGLRDFTRKLAIPLRLPSLFFQALRACIHVAQYRRQPVEVRLGGAQFLLGVLAADVQARNPRRLFEHHAPFLWLGRDDRSDTALADERRAVRTGGGIGKNQRNILGAHIAAIGPIGTARAAFYPADYLQLLIIIIGDDARDVFVRVVFGKQRDLGEIARWPLRGPGEDHIFHPAAAHRLGRILAHHPSQRLEQIGFAAAIGTDDAGQPGLDMQLGRLDEAFKACQFEPFDPHGAPRYASPAGLARACFLQLALDLRPSCHVQFGAVQVECRGARDFVLLAIFGCQVRQLLHFRRIRKASLALVTRNAALSKEFDNAHGVCKREEAVTAFERGDLRLQRLVSADLLRIGEQCFLEAHELFGQGQHGFIGTATRDTRRHQVEFVTHKVAEFVRDLAVVDEILMQFAARILGELSADMARQRGEFDQLDLRIGVADQIAALGRLADDIDPLLARRWCNCGDWFALGCFSGIAATA